MPRIKIRNPQDFGAAIMFALVGLAAVWFSQAYSPGTLSSMGPGYLPRLVGWCLLGLAAIVAIRSLTLEGPAIDVGAPRPIAFIIAAILAFALLIETTGLGPAAFLTTVTATFALRPVRWLEALALSLALTVFSVALFIYGLGQPLSAFGG